MDSNRFCFFRFVYLCLVFPFLVQINESARPLGDSETNPDNGYRSNSFLARIKTMGKSVLDDATGIPELNDFVPSSDPTVGRIIRVAVETARKSKDVIDAMQDFGNKTTTKAVLEDLTQPSLSAFHHEISKQPTNQPEKSTENGYRSDSVLTRIKNMGKSVLDKVTGISALGGLVSSNNSAVGKVIGVALSTVSKSINAVKAFGNKTTVEPTLRNQTRSMPSRFHDEISKQPNNHSEFNNSEHATYANSNGSNVWYEEIYLPGIYSGTDSNDTNKIILSSSSNGTESPANRINVVQGTEDSRNTPSSIFFSYKSENDNRIDDNPLSLKNSPKEYSLDQRTSGPLASGNGASEMYKMAHISPVEEEVNGTSDAPLPKVSMELNVRGQRFKILMHKINPRAFLPDAYVSVITEEPVEARKESDIATMEDLKTYEGTVENDSGSYVCGSIVDDVFRGFAMLSNGTVIYTKYTTSNENSENLVADKGTDAEHRNCNDSKHPNKCHDSSPLDPHFCKREGNHKILCFQGKEKQSNFFLTSFGKERAKLFRPKTISNASCAVRLVSDPSHYVESHHKNVLNVVRELLVVFLHANHILRHADLNGDGEPENLHLRLASITVFATEKDRNQWKGHSVMIRKWEKLSMQPQDGCMNIVFVSKRLIGEPDSIAKEGGVCMGNKREGEAAHNVAIINTEYHMGRSLSATCWATTMVVGQIMGSYKTDCASDPDPPPLLDWRRFFTECRGINIANTLTLRGFCLERSEAKYRQFEPEPVVEILCGNGIVEEPEECDCGSILECATKTHCCIPPGRVGECMLDRSKGYKCNSVDRCCTPECQLVPASSKHYCGTGDPMCSSINAYCNGISPLCPFDDDVSQSFNGRPCGAGGDGFCVDGFCNNTLCYRSGLMNCKCNASSECRVCCRTRAKGSPCVFAEELGLNSSLPKLLYRNEETCGENQLGRCNEIGVCSLKQSSGAPKHQSTGILRYRMFEFIFISFTIFWRSIVLKIIL